uniref:MORN repeat-containing protein 5 n=1 Tax=Anopheles dirus TaxID=7168 RepID=A0A182N8J8_9DIPT
MTYSTSSAVQPRYCALRLSSVPVDAPSLPELRRTQTLDRNMDCVQTGFLFFMKESTICPKDGKKLYKRYEGPRNSKNEPSGNGIAKLTNGDHYEGSFRKGVFHGHGVLQNRAGHRYAGAFRKGLREGRGHQTYPDCSTYDGDWTKGVRHGYGVYRYSNKDIYEGNWCLHRKHGIGVYLFAENSLRLRGSWNEGRLAGPVEIVFGSVRYHGIWEGNVLSDADESVFNIASKYLLRGLMQRAPFDEYQWIPSKLERYCFAALPLEPLPVPIPRMECQDADSSDESLLNRYEGPRNSKNEPSGNGIAKLTNGDHYEGSFRKGVFHGHGVLQNRAGHRYAGAFRKGLREGRGHQTYPDCSTYDGDWTKGVRHGYGVYRYSNKDIYEGNWCLHRKHGIGVYLFAENSLRLRGSWNEGRLAGPVEIVFGSVRYHGIWEGNVLSDADESVFNIASKYLLRGLMQRAPFDEYQWIPSKLERYCFAALPLEPLPVPIPRMECQDADSSDESLLNVSI